MADRALNDRAENTGAALCGDRTDHDDGGDHAAREL